MLQQALAQLAVCRVRLVPDHCRLAQPTPRGGQCPPGRWTGNQEGNYQIEGLVPGKHRVEIQGTRKTNKKVPDPLIPTHLVYEEAPVVPPKYNQKSTLFKEVSAGLNPVDFELEGIRK